MDTIKWIDDRLLKEPVCPRCNESNKFKIPDEILDLKSFKFKQEIRCHNCSTYFMVEIEKALTYKTYEGKHHDNPDN